MFLPLLSLLFAINTPKDLNAEKVQLNECSVGGQLFFGGQTMAHVFVKLTNKAKGQNLETETDSQGYYCFNFSVELGDEYTIYVFHPKSPKAMGSRIRLNELKNRIDKRYEHPNGNKAK